MRLDTLKHLARVVLSAAEPEKVVVFGSASLLPLFPVLEFVELSDYKVRILDNEAATGAIPRVMIEFIDTQTGRRWTTASADSNIITASMNALVDGLEYMLEHRNNFVEREN